MVVAWSLVEYTKPQYVFLCPAVTGMILDLCWRSSFIASRDYDFPLPATNQSYILLLGLLS